MIAIIEDELEQITSLFTNVLSEDSEIQAAGVYGILAGTEERLNKELKQRPPTPLEIIAAEDVKTIVDILVKNNIYILIVDQDLSAKFHDFPQNGIDTILNIKKSRPDIVPMLYTGHDVPDEIINAINERSVFFYMCKGIDTNEDIRIKVKKAIQHKESIDDYRKMATTYSTALEYRDPYTGNHSEEVQTLSLKIVDKMKEKNYLVKFGINNVVDFKKDISNASLLHDIGKIAIREGIIAKAGKLTYEEKLEIETHPIISANMLKEFPVEVRAYVRHHHERIDGSGYPYGLRNNNIPLGARIIALADSYHAMTSNRPYRNAMDLSIVLDELRLLSGNFRFAHWYEADIFECLAEVIIHEQKKLLGDVEVAEHYCRDFFLLTAETFDKYVEQIVNSAQAGRVLPHTIGVLALRLNGNRFGKSAPCQRCQFAYLQHAKGCANDRRQMIDCFLYDIFSKIKRTDGIIKTSRLNNGHTEDVDEIIEYLSFITPHRVKDSYVIAKNSLVNILKTAALDGHLVISEINRNLKVNSGELIQKLFSASRSPNYDYQINILE